MAKRQTEDIADGRKVTLRQAAALARKESAAAATRLDDQKKHGEADRVAQEGVRSASSLEVAARELDK